MDDGPQLHCRQEAGELGRKAEPKDQRVGSGMVVSAVAGLLSDHRRNESGTCFEQRRWSELGSYGGRLSGSEGHFRGRQTGFSVKALRELNVTFAAAMDVADSKLRATSCGLPLSMMQLATSPTPIVAGWIIANMVSAQRLF